VLYRARSASGEALQFSLNCRRPLRIGLEAVLGPQRLLARCGPWFETRGWNCPPGGCAGEALCKSGLGAQGGPTNVGPALSRPGSSFIYRVSINNGNCAGAQRTVGNSSRKTAGQQVMRLMPVGAVADILSRRLSAPRWRGAAVSPSPYKTARHIGYRDAWADRIWDGAICCWGPGSDDRCLAGSRPVGDRDRSPPCSVERLFTRTGMERVDFACAAIGTGLARSPLAHCLTH